jgi:outer membrane protein TolC
MENTVSWGLRMMRLALGGMVCAGWAATSIAQNPDKPLMSLPRSATELKPLDETRPADSDSLPPPANSILSPETKPIDLATALRLSGVQSPELLIARQRVVEGEALHMIAAAQYLPSLNAGMNYDSHTGALQDTSGAILSLNRTSLYLGSGANAVSAGSVNIPGVVLTGNVATVVFGELAARQLVKGRQAAAVGVRNQVFLAVTRTYCELLRAYGQLAVATTNRDESHEIARLTAEYSASGVGRKADADRAATELAQREADILAAEGMVISSVARLCQVINVDPSVRLAPTDAYVVPMPIVPGPMPLPELIAIGLLQRPELADRQALIRESMYVLEGAKLLPFSPTILLGYSGGVFGGGSNVVRPIFGGLNGRQDLDAMAFWTLRNLGIGNIALIREADARMKIARLQQVAVLNQVRAEVTEAYARIHARFGQIGATETAVRNSTLAFHEDLARIKDRAERTVLPIELLNSFRLLAQSRILYLNAIVDYNEAHFGMYVALGQPPADMLARPVPVAGVTAPTLPPPGTDPAVPPVNPTPPPPGVDRMVTPIKPLGRFSPSTAIRPAPQPPATIRR